MADPQGNSGSGGARMNMTAPPRPGGERAGTGAMARIEEHRAWLMLAKMPMKLEVRVPVPGFKVRNLLALRPGITVTSAWKTSEDVPLWIGGVQIAWNEFEVVEQKLAIRLTRLA